LFGKTGTIIDLTYNLSRETPVYPGSMGFLITQRSKIIKDGKRTSGLKLTTHTGTHIDAPSHVCVKGKTIEKISLDKFMGRALLLTLTPEKYKKKTYNFEDLNGERDLIKDVDILIIKVGDSSSKAGIRNLFQNYPVPDESVIKFILIHKIKFFGTDAISVDEVNSKEMGNHRRLLKENILIVEGLFNLDKLISNVFFFMAVPLNIVKADGSPCRAMAIPF